MILGIDPGKEGGLAFIDGSNIKARRMPINKQSKQIDVSEIQRLIIENRVQAAAIEKQFVSGRQAGGLTIGANYGRLLAVLELCGVPYIEIKSDHWQPKIRQWLANDHVAVPIAKTKKERKNLSRIYCQHMNYEIPILRSGRVHDGCSDAVCIGVYGTKLISTIT